MSVIDNEVIFMVPPPPLPQDCFSREDILFDEKKNSWLSFEVAMSFSLRQRGNLHEENILVGWGWREKEREDFLFDEEKTHCSPPSPLQQGFSLVRISSLTKRKTHCCSWKLPWGFLFVKEENLRGKFPCGGVGGGRNVRISSLTKQKTSLKLQ